MNKDYKNPPAFQFYAQDFMTGTLTMTNEEVGIFLRLLLVQWTKNIVAKERLIRIIDMDWEHVPPIVKEKFDDRGDYLINKRLLEYSIERRAFIEKQRSNGQKGGRPKNPKVNPNKSSSLKNEERREKKEVKEVVYPYNDADFIASWKNWKEYKKLEFKFNYKSLQSEQAALTQLGNNSKDKQEAMYMMINAMAKGWKGIYKVKENEKNNKTKARYSDSFKREIIEGLQS
tara:strand:+ start:9709 stop:10398 length:690 start_codon:yes stop_codon:yes gene_type:complete